MGMGGSKKSSSLEIPLGDILKLVDFFQQRKAADESGAAMIPIAGLDANSNPKFQEEPVTIGPEGASPNILSQIGGGVVRMPGVMNTPDYSALGSSHEGRNVLTEIIKAQERGKVKSTTPGTFHYVTNENNEVVAIPSTNPTGPAIKTGVTVKGKNNDTASDIYVDNNNISWRINYDKVTGKELSRVKQGPVSKEKRDAYQSDAILQRQVNNFNSSPAVQKVEQMDQFSNLIIDAANSDNPIAHASLETLMARASGEVGNLSEADKKPFGGSRALVEKTKQALSEIYSGRKTPENLEFISQLADTFKQSGQRKKQAIARERAKQISSANKSMGWTPEFVFGVLSPDGVYDEKNDSSKSKDVGRFKVEVIP
jgi:hypothetical protein